MKRVEVDYLVIGAGIAGLSAAEYLSDHGRVAVLSKGKIKDSSTHYAQGGIAVAMHSGDTPKHHFEDTLIAGDGLCMDEHVRALVEEGPDCVRKLIGLGANFDKTDQGYSLAQEGAHRKRRILHAGDATGREIEKTLGRSVLGREKVTFYQDTQVCKLDVKDQTCRGCLAWVKNELTYFSAKAVLLATGGYGQVYERSSNPPFTLGDGIAMAYRAGCEVMDMEFIQFHPTTLVTGDQEPISLFLISEAVRGEGAWLRNRDGDRFMLDVHPDAELAPRDVVARAIVAEMQKTGDTNVYLDLSQMKVDIPSRFPSITQRCLEAKIDITREWVPVSPAAHYCIGGVKIDTHGRTSLGRLYAAGEVSASGIHGANRLASNSLLEGLVFGYRAAHEMAKETPVKQVKVPDVEPEDQLPVPSSELKRLKHKLKAMMWDKVGIVREKETLQEALDQLTRWRKDTQKPCLIPEWVDWMSMVETSYLTSKMALERTESRGAHFRKDFPEKNPDFLTHQTTQI